MFLHYYCNKVYTSVCKKMFVLNNTVYQYNTFLRNWLNIMSVRTSLQVSACVTINNQIFFSFSVLRSASNKWEKFGIKWFRGVFRPSHYFIAARKSLFLFCCASPVLPIDMSENENLWNGLILPKNLLCYICDGFQSSVTNLLKF